MTAQDDSHHEWPFVESDGYGWPTLEQCAGYSEYSKALCEAKLEVRKKRTDQEIALNEGDRAVERAVRQAYYQAVLDLSKASVDRARASGETVQKAAATIVTLYTGVLALAFSVAEHPLPFRALFAAFLLGLAIVMSTAFLAYLPDPDDVRDEATAKPPLQI